MGQDKLYDEAIGLLKALIALPSPSGSEQQTASVIAEYLGRHGVEGIERLQNNVWVRNRYYDPARKTILLNSHHDTVRPNSGYTRDPYSPDVEQGRLYGLGSNDAGASLVSLISVFLHYYDRRDLKYNLILAATAEEEKGGPNGIETVVPQMGDIEFALVGEPTGMQMAIAERGLVVLDCVSKGRSGHAARDEGDNAIYRAVEDIEWLRTYKFPLESALFGAVKMTVTEIHAGTQHNVVPAECRFTVDVRVTDRYTNEQVVEIIRNHVKCDVTPRSLRLKPSSIDPSHPVVQAGAALGRAAFGSPTTSDQALLSVPSFKMGPGESVRSHSADEYILLDEIKEGIDIYIKMLDRIL